MKCYMQLYFSLQTYWEVFAVTSFDYMLFTLYLVILLLHIIVPIYSIIKICFPQPLIYDSLTIL